MTHPRDIMAGMTDYTGVPLADILAHLDDWVRITSNTITVLESSLAELPEREALLENAQAVEDYLRHFIDLFNRYLGDLRRLRTELPTGVSPAHIEILKQIDASASHEESITIRFGADWVKKQLPHKEVRPYLSRIYAGARDQLVDYQDFSNLIPRLRVFLGPTPPAEALTDLHLKPNIFGIGLNLNRLFGRFVAWWQRRCQRPRA